MNTIAITLSQNRTEFFFSQLENIFAKVEEWRIRTHLRIVEHELRRKDVKCLSTALQKERNRNINHLHKYWSIGLFPKNTDFFTKRVPYFKDRFGTPCAMAYLIEQSGHRDLVNEVAHSNNHIYINDIQDGPVIDWINKSGLSKSEAARVQPTYYGLRDGLDSIFQILPWIFASVGFILLEWLSYKISSWLALGNSKRKLAAWFYFTINNLILAVIIGELVVVFIRSFWY